MLVCRKSFCRGHDWAELRIEVAPSETYAGDRPTHPPKEIYRSPSSVYINSEQKYTHAGNPSDLSSPKS